MKKLKLSYINYKNMSCIPHPHYDLHTDGQKLENIACILTDKKGAKLIRKLIKRYNESNN